MENYTWPLVGEFLDRVGELNRLNGWWDSPDRHPVALIGRRRVGKSWLFRRLAHGKPAILLVSEQLPAGAQLTRFADQLEPVLGVRPDLRDVPALFRVVYRAARAQRLLVVIDEFPWLLGTSAVQVRQTLSAIQAVIEEEQDDSKIKLVVCGSHVGQMEALFSERNPMHGRLIRTEIRPLPFGEALEFLSSADPVAAFERYAITGGMPLYLSRLAAGTTRDIVCGQILDRNGPLWNEGRAILEQELREPRVYFGILELLASGEKELHEIAAPMRMNGSVVTKYLATLMELRLVRRKQPIGSAANARSGHWRLADPFLRFWFRYVFPFQAGLESGLRPVDLYDVEIGPTLADHVSPVFEDWCRQLLRSTHGMKATVVDSWWGNAANQFRRTKERSSEEIDAVGMLRSKVTLVAECKWTNKPLDRGIVTDLETYKIPALRDAGFKIADPLRIVLFSKAGYGRSLRELANVDSRIELVDVPAELAASNRGTAPGR
ncbi:MAG: ATP-binding protein [Trebonia sp.]